MLACCILNLKYKLITIELAHHLFRIKNSICSGFSLDLPHRSVAYSSDWQKGVISNFNCITHYFRPLPIAIVPPNNIVIVSINVHHLKVMDLFISTIFSYLNILKQTSRFGKILELSKIGTS